MPPVSASEAKKASKDYYSTFKPFFVRAGVEVALVNRFALKKRAVKEEETEEMEVDGGRQLSKEGAYGVACLYLNRADAMAVQNHWPILCLARQSSAFHLQASSQSNLSVQS